MKNLTILLIFLAAPVTAGTLTPDTRISSEVLGYDLQYRAYLPDGYQSAEHLPVLFLTDGPGYIGNGDVPQVLDRIIEAGDIESVIAIFVDARDPDNLSDNRRNAQFFCNADYLKFFSDELIPKIEQDYPVASGREARTILGLSFGGLNAACFGLMGSDTFSGIGMHSPANHPVPELLSDYRDAEVLPLKIFLSTGVPNDNTRANREFHSVLEAKGYPMKYIESKEGHSWKNWRPLVDDVLLYFYGTED
jgi:enterochelin esterase-like enzyme